MSGSDAKKYSSEIRLLLLDASCTICKYCEGRSRPSRNLIRTSSISEGCLVQLIMHCMSYLRCVLKTADAGSIRNFTRRVRKWERVENMLTDVRVSRNTLDTFVLGGGPE